MEIESDGDEASRSAGEWSAITAGGGGTGWSRFGTAKVDMVVAYGLDGRRESRAYP